MHRAATRRRQARTSASHRSGSAPASRDSAAARAPRTRSPRLASSCVRRAYVCRFSDTTKNSCRDREQQDSHQRAAAGRQKARAQQALTRERQQQQTEDRQEEDDGVRWHAGQRRYAGLTKRVNSPRATDAASAAMSRSRRWSYGRYCTYVRRNSCTFCSCSVVSSGCSLSIA